MFIALLVSLVFPGTTFAQTQTDPEPDPDGGYQVGPPESQADNPVTTLRAVVAALDAQLERPDLPTAVLAKLRHARERTDDARAHFLALDSRLDRVVGDISTAVNTFDVAARASADPALRAELHRQGGRLGDVAQALAANMLGVARAAGVDPTRLARAEADLASGDRLLAIGDPGGAAKFYKKVLPIKNALVFDIPQFRARLRFVLDGQTTGYAVAVNQDGMLVDSWGNGFRRMPADSNPPIPFTPSDELNIASITKTLTAATVLELLQSRGISVDDPIAPYLPWDWARPHSAGSVIDPGALTFRRLMTHTSGLGGRDDESRRRGCGMRFDGIKACIAAGARASDQEFFYDNGNFALLRVMLINIIGGCNNADDGCLPLEDQQTAWAYRTHVQCDLLRMMGLSDGVLQDPFQTCEGPALAPNPAEAPATRFYWFPQAVGSVEPTDWLLSAGGGGWYFSALELAQFLAHLRYNDKILTPTTRATMYEGFLGWMDPANYGSMATGVFGTYRMHGGDLCYPNLPVPEGVSVCAAAVQPRGVDTCIVDFPTGVQVVLLINSMGGAYPYQCRVLRDVHDASWTKK
ncbi:serine hydrolase [Luteimonas sp. R10]|uniref:serine hydrolase n=1 Tax=Luteimonas sp. R10 TaxID=3108176 RepID=UPI00308CBC55|nr:serine hydrolase [Luteimonas sp. R10]